ncbi:hypothetical protein MPSI1_001439 [Malassezia psittaci]|uniref:Uncharacterized protein n=1 Tax=Malassezia psittaci TaxID=1821823 RepID=A0AAF0F9I2_9BASI|nr:hypothetical protein MPSI1_001439 [Malassezia psittaci]
MPLEEDDAPETSGKDSASPDSARSPPVRSPPQPIPIQHRHGSRETERRSHHPTASPSTSPVNEDEQPLLSGSSLSPSGRRRAEGRAMNTSPQLNSAYNVSRSLQKRSSQSFSSINTPSSPPGGNWIQHSDRFWPEGGQFRASSSARNHSALAESSLESSHPDRLSSPVSSTLAPDSVNSVWIDPPADSANGRCASPAHSDASSDSSSEGSSGGDRLSHGLSRLSFLSLCASPPVSGDMDSSAALSSGNTASNLSSSPRDTNRENSTVHFSTPDSPPKVRSNIALPPRSGYSLSDDSDSVRSENEGSNGSGLSSSGSETEPDVGGSYDDDDDEEDKNRRLTQWQMARKPSPALPAQSRFEDNPLERSSIEEEDTSNDADAEDEIARDIRSDHEKTPFATRDLDDSDDMFMNEFVQEPILDPLVSETPSSCAETESLEEGLNCLERIFLFAKSDMAYHRVLVSRCLTEWIREVDLTDAVEYVIPLLNELATDEIEVSAVFAPELGRLMWFFFRNCPLSELNSDDSSKMDSNEEMIPRPKLAVGIFTPMLCTLLLNPNSAVSGATQASIVEFFLRSKQYEEVVDKGKNSNRDLESPINPEDVRSADLVVQGNAREGKMVPLAPYDFPCEAREAILNELFDNVAIAISRFDNGDDSSTEKQSGLSESNGSRPLPSEMMLSRSFEHGQYDEESALGRMMSVNLLAAITVEGGFSLEQLALRVVPEITNWPLDPAFFVRKEVAAAIGIIGKALASQQEKQESPTFHYSESGAPQRLLAAINRVLLDHVWQVRQAACYSLPGVFALQPTGPDRRRDLVIVMRALNQDVSPNVQLAAFEMIGEVIYLFHNDPEGVPIDLLRIFLGQANESSGDNLNATHFSDLLSNPDKSLIVAFNFPAVILTVGASHWSEFRDLYLQLTTHSSESVRNSLCASLHEVARLIGPQAASQDLVSVAEHFLHDPCPEVTGTLLEHFHEFLLVLPVDAAKTQLRQLPNLWLSRFAHDWRLRESLAKHIPSLAPSLLLADEDGCLVTLLLLALNDSVNALREEGVRSVPVAYATFRAQDDAIADGFLSMLCDLVEASAYRQRVTFLHLVRALVLHGISRERFEALILQHLLRLAHDPVIDVQIALAQTAREIWQSTELYPDASERPLALMQLIVMLRNHPSKGVCRPVSGLLSDMVHASIHASLPPCPPRPSRDLQLGPARPLLDTTTMLWNASEMQNATQSVDQNADTSQAMDQDP